MPWKRDQGYDNDASFSDNNNLDDKGSQLVTSYGSSASKDVVKKSGSWSAGDEDRDNNRLVYKYSVSLDSKGDFILHWNLDDVTKTIFMRIEAKIGSSDLLAFGFSAYGESENADFCILRKGLDVERRFEVSLWNDLLPLTGLNP